MTLRLLDGKYEQFIFVSTASMCANNRERIKEEDVVENSGWKYIFDKKEAETYLREFHSGKSSWYTIVRPYITYSEKRLPFQFSPLKYYTNINRILCDKPIPVCNMDAHTTFISDYAFAIGCVGLVMNPYSRNEAFNVTSDKSMEWREIYHRVYSAVSTKEFLVELPKEFIMSYQIRGFDKNEVLYDKSIDRRFDNKKISNAVPAFREVNSTCTYYDFKHVIDYYNKNREMQVIDYRWDARIDNMFAKWYRKNGIVEYKDYLSIKAYKNDLRFLDKINYILYRHDATFLICRVMSGVFQRFYSFFNR